MRGMWTLKKYVQGDHRLPRCATDAAEIWTCTHGMGHAVAQRARIAQKYGTAAVFDREGKRHSVAMAEAAAAVLRAAGCVVELGH